MEYAAETFMLAPHDGDAPLATYVTTATLQRDGAALAYEICIANHATRDVVRVEGWTTPGQLASDRAEVLEQLAEMEFGARALFAVGFHVFVYDGAWLHADRTRLELDEHERLQFCREVRALYE